MFMNLQALRAVLMVVCAVALAFVAWRFILPLAVQYMAGVGVEVPLPKRLVMAYPKLSIYLFNLCGPLLFLALAVAFFWLLRLRVTPR
jgi:hypothetical protein